MKSATKIRLNMREMLDPDSSKSRFGKTCCLGRILNKGTVNDIDPSLVKPRLSNNENVETVNVDL